MKYKEAMELITEEISTLFKTGDYVFSVLGQEGDVPHLHFYIDNPLNTKNSGCIALENNGYANHGKHNSTLDSKTLLIIKTYLSIQENWIKACNDWNSDEANKRKITNLSIEANPYYAKEFNTNESELKKYFKTASKVDYNVFKIKYRKDIKAFKASQNF